MKDGYLDLAPLNTRHQLDDFRCTSALQTEWLQRYSSHNLRAGTAVKVHVITEEANPEDVVAYFAWCMSAVPFEMLPPRFTQGAGGYPVQPFVLLARLGVHEDHEGKGLGGEIFKHVMAETLEYSKTIGCRGLLIHAERDEAVQFYRNRIDSFANLTNNEHHLVLLAKDIDANLSA